MRRCHFGKFFMDRTIAARRLPDTMSDDRKTSPV